MEAKKLLTIALTGLLAGGCLMVPALAEDADGQSSGNPATYTIPARVKRIEDYAFAGDTSLERVKIPDGVTEIGDYAFSGCTNLQEIELPDGLTKIGNHAFDGCTALVRLGDMNQLESIGEYAFSGCEALESIGLCRSCKLSGIMRLRSKRLRMRTAEQARRFPVSH